MASSIPPPTQPPIQRSDDPVLSVLNMMPELLQQSVRSDVPSPREGGLESDQSPLLANRDGEDEDDCCDQACDCTIL